MMHNHHRTVLLLLLVVIFYSTPAVRSQSSGCYFTAMNLYGPTSVQEGQKFEVHTLFSVTCPGGGEYTIRADLVDARTGQILSTYRTTYPILGPFAAVFTNSVVAPRAGWWSLQMNLYVLGSNGVPVGPQSQQIFGLTITSSTPTASIVIS
ncbi:MAG: hypothetical protein ABSA92_08655 [Candidatus Bathyarchaeia archaeon]|jgi:hypothetical protein